MVDTAHSRGYGFAVYKWRPLDSEEEFKKTVFFERVDRLVICGGLCKKNGYIDAI
jgi:hypothetical protein